MGKGLSLQANVNFLATMQKIAADLDGNGGLACYIRVRFWQLFREEHDVFPCKEFELPVAETSWFYEEVDRMLATLQRSMRRTLETRIDFVTSHLAEEVDKLRATTKSS